MESLLSGHRWLSRLFLKDIWHKTEMEEKRRRNQDIYSLFAKGAGISQGRPSRDTLCNSRLAPFQESCTGVSKNSGPLKRAPSSRAPMMGAPARRTPNKQKHPHRLLKSDSFFRMQ